MADHFDSNSFSLFLAWFGSIWVFLATIAMVFIPVALFTKREQDWPRWIPWFGVYFFLCLVVISPLRYVMLQLVLSESYFVQSIGAATDSFFLMLYVPFVVIPLYVVAIILPALPAVVLTTKSSNVSGVIATILTPLAFAVGYALFFLLLPYAAWTIRWLPARDVIRSANGPATVFHKLVVEPDIPRIGPRLEIQEGETANKRLRSHILVTYVSPFKRTKHHFFSSLFSIKQVNGILNNQEEGFFVTIPDEDLEAIKALEKTALREALQVDTELLTRRFDGLGAAYRENFIAGLQDVIHGNENSNNIIEVRGHVHLNEWHMWFNEHYDAIRDAL